MTKLLKQKILNIIAAHSKLKKFSPLTFSAILLLSPLLFLPTTIGSLEAYALMNQQLSCHFTVDDCSWYGSGDGSLVEPWGGEGDDGYGSDDNRPPFEGGGGGEVEGEDEGGEDPPVCATKPSLPQC